ncbi:acyl-CoA synthetase (AMP-forming)/AMP-acid ligase II/acyl carrier protein [Rhodopirellula rubra]|uniref:Acyl-CoA synthetase (AMP-forming)/AMP-acid ligase II/acyl carrier protein n=1 Tax=Aporhodopirellula rubra TaxID=980271 RepID=A0A7W5H9P0_9BACT|nr:AMP-binding protein [Aporhodopirellula rubra]MBB3210325.1 acyl-CoA synthetase (AMP-forming)/AMP-acid ligase II/acyl carrier protein [Aporhodopirellula rubra]
MHRNTDSAVHPLSHRPSLVHVLRERASRHPDRAALSFIDDDQIETTLTYAGLESRVFEVANRILAPGSDSNPRPEQSQAGVRPQPGDRALLLFPPGLEFIVGLLACQASRVVPVPTCFPKPGRAMPRLDAAAKDCLPSLLLADSKTIDGIDAKRISDAVMDLRFVATDATVVAKNASPDRTQTAAGPTQLLAESIANNRLSDLAFLQYTSGSTSSPKGVMVSHENLLTNLESIRKSFGLTVCNDADDDLTRGVFWLPHYHDMGLIGGILETIFIGGHTTLMSPRSFLAKPLRWLTAIADRKATVSGAPNFAYELCIDRVSPDEAAEIDLRSWQVAFCGAEPIAAATLDRFAQRFKVSGFRHESLLPCYGLAEATLLVASDRAATPYRKLRLDRDGLRAGRVTPVSDDHPRNLTRAIVGCGQPAGDMQIEIVDPVRRTRVNEGEIGEVWLCGQSIARGYWQREDDNEVQFRASINDDADAREFLRTGDLGFVHGGDLFITGRCKDVIILRGRNYYPHDIEATIHQALGEDAVRCVAVATDAFVGDAMSVIVEVARHVDDVRLPEIVRRVRRRIIDEHEVDARQVVLARPGAIPITTSGKLKRSECRRLLQSDEIAARYQWMRSIITDDSVATQLPPLPEHVDERTIGSAIDQIQSWLMAWLVARCGAIPGHVTPETPFAEHGLDSMAAVELSGELDDWLGVELTPILAANYPTPAQLAVYLAEEMRGAATKADSGLVGN